MVEHVKVACAILLIFKSLFFLSVFFLRGGGEAKFVCGCFVVVLCSVYFDSMRKSDMKRFSLSLFVLTVQTRWREALSIAYFVKSPNSPFAHT